MLFWAVGTKFVTPVRAKKVRVGKYRQTFVWEAVKAMHDCGKACSHFDLTSLESERELYDYA